MMLISACFAAPLMAVRRRWPDVLHAVDMEHVIDGWERGSYVSACGLNGLRLVGMNAGGETVAACWPPRLKGMPERMERCRTCWLETGRMRPRVDFVAL